MCNFVCSHRVKYAMNRVKNNMAHVEFNTMKDKKIGDIQSKDHISPSAHLVEARGIEPL